MKMPHFFLVAVVIGVSACNHSQETVEANISEKDTAANKTTLPVAVCYASYGKDSVRLNVEIIEKAVTGSLLYKPYQKDSNSGNVEGLLKGDTLLANYTFMSEGVQSVRQVIFLLQDSIAIEGYGDMEDKNGNMIFKNSSRIIFGTGYRLQKTDCK
jgi:hypothetical protein